MMSSLVGAEITYSRCQFRMRAKLIFLSTLAFVSLPSASSWLSHSSAITFSSQTCNGALCRFSNFRFYSRFESSILYRKTKTNGCLHLRSQESPKGQSDVAVLNARLWSASELGDEQTIRTLISVGAEVNSRPVVPQPDEDQKQLLAEPIYGPSALHLAAGNGKSKAVCALVELGADVTSKDADLATPLHLAVIGGHLGWTASRCRSHFCCSFARVPFLTRFLY